VENGERKNPNLLLEKIKYIYEIRKVSAKISDDTISEPIQINKGIREGCGLLQYYLTRILIQLYRNSK
jgi:hypothetical protein